MAEFGAEPGRVHQRCSMNPTKYQSDESIEQIRRGIDGISVITSPDNDAFDCVSFNDLYAVVSEEARGFDFHLVDSERLPFEAGAFDIVISHHVIEHVADDDSDFADFAKFKGLELLDLFAYGSFDLFLGITEQSGRYTAQFYVQNLFDEFHVISKEGQIVVGVESAHGLPYDYTRRFGVSLRMDF